jgi:hypothetical protein
MRNLGSALGNFLGLAVQDFFQNVGRGVLHEFNFAYFGLERSAGKKV